MAAKKERQLNYELLRIIAMLMIVSLHYLGKGGLLGDPARSDMTASGYAAWLIEAFCLVAVNVYVLISGYFGVDTPAGMKNGNGHTFWDALQRPLKIWKQVFFYSVVIGFGAVIIGAQEFDIYQAFTYCFPIVTEHYWFASSYVILCLMMPFINAGFSYLGEKQVRYLLTGFLLLFCISKTVIPMRLPWDNLGYDCVWFMILYLTGAYLRRYGIRLLKARWRAVALYFGSVAVIFASFFIIRMMYLKTARLQDMINYGYTYNFLFCYTGAVGLFLAFAPGQGQNRAARILERFRKPVERFAGASFGVYLIHEHVNIRYEWTKWLRCDAQADSVLGMLGHMIVVVTGVYLACTLIELIRQKSTFTVLPALALLLYPLRHAAVGIDLMDAGYSLGNYRFFETVYETWKLATYLANVIGVMLSKLPFGYSWAGMNVYCGLLVGAVAAGVYLYLWKRYGQNRQGLFFLLFTAEITALSLCWAPTVILYHYLGYLFMTAAAVLLFEAITKNKKTCFVISGVILGLCVAVRMPNVTYMALILPVWCDCFWKRQSYTDKSGNKITWIKELLIRTLFCVGGYIAGVIVPLLTISVCYGVSAYPQMVASLFGMTDHAADYKPVSMVRAMFGDYLNYSVWLLLFVGYMAAGILCFYMVGRFVQHAWKKKVTTALKVCYALGVLVLLRFCYGRGMFDFDYTDNFCMYKWVTVYLLSVIAICVWCLSSRRIRKDYRIWAVFLLVIIFVTPLGSNNGLYPIVNNLFLVLPVSILIISEMFRQSKKSVNGFAFRLVFGFVLACVSVQSVLFGIGFVFHDAGAQSGRERLHLLCSNAGTGLLTTADKKAELTELDAYLYQSALNERQVILYGNVPALAYLLDMEPAISSTWPDLDSYGLDSFQEQLDHLAAQDRNTDETEAFPVIIFGRSRIEHLTEADGFAYKKLRIVREFMEANHYAECFKNAGYIVYAAQ
ncbi:MAG: acyltransferase [Lachnospiraceae bacterium]|nr:acyltransferase [Lachnospiraceae bacterium]